MIMGEQSTTKGFAVLSAAGMIVKVISVLYVPLLIIIIGDEAYGVYYAAYTIFVFVYVLTNSGIPIAISKLVSELIALNNYKDAIKAFKLARALLFILGLVTSSLLIMLAYPLVKSFNNLQAYFPVIALAPTILITSTMSSYRGYFQGCGNMTPTAISQIMEQIINTVFSLFFAAILISKSMELGLVGATVGTTLGALVACVYLIKIYEKNKKNSIPGIEVNTEVKRLSNKAIFNKLLNYSLPMTLCVVLQNSGILIDMINIKNRLLVAGFNDSISNIKVGVLGKYNVLIYVPIAIISALSAAALPALTSVAVINDKRAVRLKIDYIYRLCFLVAIPSAVGLGVLSRPIYKLLFPTYVESYVLMQYGSLLVVLIAVVQIQTTILQSIGKLYAVIFSLMLGILVKIISNYILVAIPSINILGAIVGNMLCFIIPLILNHYVMRKSLRIKVNMIRHMIKPAIASAFMGFMAYIVYFYTNILIMSYRQIYIISIIPTILSISVGIIVYLYGLVLTGGITKKDLNALSPRITKVVPQFIKNRIR